MTEDTKRTWVEVDLGALAHNYQAVRNKLAPGTKFMGVVKANAYGHGAVRVSKLLSQLGCDYLAVACLEEALQLRQAGITIPILILGYTPPKYAQDLAENHITQAIGNMETAKAMSDQLAGTGLRVKVHIKLETGMGRTGFRSYGEQTLSDAAQAACLPNLEAEGIFTHFCVSDEEETVRDFTKIQFQRFREGLEYIERQSGNKFAIRHCTNSGALISFPETYMDMVRPGAALYGVYPGPYKGDLELIPAMSLKTRVAYVEKHEPGDTISYGRTYTVDRPSRIAVLPVGYADGLHRILSNRLTVDFQGKRARQVGRICMDMCMVDVTDLDIKSGDVAEIFGRSIPVKEVADLAGTIHYEIYCGIAPRVPRVYI